MYTYYTEIPVTCCSCFKTEALHIAHNVIILSFNNRYIVRISPDHFINASLLTLLIKNYKHAYTQREERIELSSCSATYDNYMHFIVDSVISDSVIVNNSHARRRVPNTRPVLIQPVFENTTQHDGTKQRIASFLSLLFLFLMKSEWRAFRRMRKIRVESRFALRNFYTDNCDCLISSLLFLFLFRHLNKCTKQINCTSHTRSLCAHPAFYPLCTCWYVPRWEFSRLQQSLDSFCSFCHFYNRDAKDSWHFKRINTSARCFLQVKISLIIHHRYVIFVFRRTFFHCTFAPNRPSFG